MTVEWKRPPEVRKGRGRAAVIDADVAELKKDPGEWARVQRAVAASGEPYKARGCEVTTVRVQSRPARFDVYARWPEGS